MKATQLLYFTLIIPLLSGCYCFNEIMGKSSVKDLTVAKRIDLCHTQRGGSFISLTPYYGFPSTDKDSLQRMDALATNYNSTGLIGARGEAWVGLGKLFPFRILGLGFDYSFNESKSELTNSGMFTDYSRTLSSNRILGSINLMTLVQSRWIGYATVQFGVDLQKSFYSKYDYASIQKKKLFDYRLGYGVQFYPNLPIGISLEAGYGGGGYIKAGLTFWLF